MNKKGFAISIILYSMVFLLISIFYLLLSISKGRYIVSSNLRNNIIEEFNTSYALYDIVAKLGDDSSVDYVLKYPLSNGAPVDTPDGSGSDDVYYFRGLNSNNTAGQNGNVIFGDYCWLIVRTTANGGVRLLYNGPKTSDNKCPKEKANRPSSYGVVGSTVVDSTSLTGSKSYGESFEIFNAGGTYKFRLKNVNTYTWSDSTYQNILGKYVCGTSSSPTGTDTTCTVLYFVGRYQSNTTANTEKYTIAANTSYTVIGTSPFSVNSNLPSANGYMYNDNYVYYGKYFPLTLSINYTANVSTTTTFYYGDRAVWNSSTNMYDLQVDDGNGNYVTPTTRIAWSDIRSNVQGKYTCRSTSSTSCPTVSYVVINSSNTTMTYMNLSNNEDVNTKSFNAPYGTGYTESNGTYTLTGGGTLNFLFKDWQTVRNNSIYKDFYVCSDLTSSSCSEIYHIGSNNVAYMYYNKSSENYYFGDSVAYSNGSYTISINSDPTKYFQLWDLYKDSDKIANAHYTCFKANSNSCGSSVNYAFYSDKNNVFTITLTGGDRVTDSLEKMLNLSNSSSSTLNRYNSAIKSVLDSWYESNLLGLESFMDEDAVYCNNRFVLNLGSWGNATNITTPISYKGGSSAGKVSLGCDNITDRFSKNNTGVAELKYPIGLLSLTEATIIQKHYYYNDSKYWLMTPDNYSNHYAYFYYATSPSTSSGIGSTYSNGVRPVITIKYGVEVSGKGTYNEPYIINTGE